MTFCFASDSVVVSGPFYRRQIRLRSQATSATFSLPPFRSKSARADELQVRCLLHPSPCAEQQLLRQLDANLTLEAAAGVSASSETYPRQDYGQANPSDY